MTPRDILADRFVPWAPRAWRHVAAVVLGMAAVSFGCSSDQAENPSRGGALGGAGPGGAGLGDPSSGGSSTSSGGDGDGSGGASGLGGAATGGLAALGGATSGGAPGLGGSTSGGAPGLGGATSGGEPGLGGSTSGGAPNLGGAISGGSAGLGGVSELGGATSGGATGSGGATSGGGPGLGGSTSGGAPNLGGATSGGSAGTGGVVDPCTNGVQDAGEEGVDCGGSCSPCEVVYRIGPPSPCHDDTYIEDCANGTSPSCSAALGGSGCTVANVCEADTSKIGLPVTHACPRHMLFSPEMVQAAKDDAVTYGWPNPDDPPFTYAVAGHDIDTGGVDSGLTGNSCCQCYQLVLGTPLDNAPQPPRIPVPKPLIVQTFNTAAGGPMSFDLFMAVGGYGAFNGCYNDPNFQNTATTYGEFAYTGFPDPNALTQPNMLYYEGGLRYLNLEVCNSLGDDYQPSADAVQSAECQDRIEELCNQIESPSAMVTNTSRASCIEGNRYESLYHQNWRDSIVKRIECPEAFTRVTGCKIPNQGLPSADPDVRTVGDNDGSFLTGYGTTTMQDCCKPTCAWHDNINVTTDPEFRSFYSCDVMGEPITAY